MSCLSGTGMSVLFLLLDDMRADQLPVLAQTNAWMSEHAVVFDRNYVTDPLCCPERSSFLSGGYLPQYTGVLTNQYPRGGATQFIDTDTIAVRLQRQGYHTAIVGKYLNEYPSLEPYIPPGWSDWAVTTEDDPWWDFDVTIGSTGPDQSGTGSSQHIAGYITDWQGDAGKNILLQKNELFFLYLSFMAPHDPHQPAQKDEGAYKGFTYRGGAYQEEDVSDKPDWIQKTSKLSSEQIEMVDRENQQKMETLLSVDRAILQLLNTLKKSGQLDNTIVILSSDNGDLWGEHRLTSKGLAYEESVRMPLVLWNPRFQARHSDALVAENLDLAATIEDLAGLPPRGNGTSLLPFLCGETEVVRELVPLQSWASPEHNWAGGVTSTYKYIETTTGEMELYDLSKDPFEMDNLADMAPQIVKELATALAPYRGLGITTAYLPDAQKGQYYETQLKAWGGEGTLTWHLYSGGLPAGLHLSEEGVLSGVPEKMEQSSFEVEVEDQGASSVIGGPSRDRLEYRLMVGSGRSSGCCNDNQSDTVTAETFDSQKYNPMRSGIALFLLLGWRRRRLHTPQGQ